MNLLDIRHDLGEMDIYLVDQLMRGNIASGMTILDAGCGGGRNLPYFLRRDYEVFAADVDTAAVERVRDMADMLAPELPPSNFRVEAVESMSFTERSADVVISSAVLHFARDEAHFGAMVDGSWRMLKPGGMLFWRLASEIGMEGRFEPLGGRRFRLLDGSERFLVSEEMLMAETARLGGTLVDPLKTTVVQGMRCMTTWVLRRQMGPALASP